jgi:DUF4097 and DUF4098 domain-containing protein YvlB
MGQQQIVITPRGPSRLRLATGSGRIRVRTEERTDIVVEANKPGIEGCEFDESGVATVHLGSQALVLDVRCPTGTDIAVGTGSGAIELRGEYGKVAASSQSGTITIHAAREVDARTGSGGISLGVCDHCRLHTKSGRAVVGRAGSAEVATASGAVSVASAAGQVRVRSASGNVDVGTSGRNDVSVETLSGAVTVRLPGGVRPDAALRTHSGQPAFECEPGSDCRVAVQTLSGKIAVVHA